MIEFVRLDNVKEGDVLARTLYDNNLRVLLKVGNKITKRAIDLLKSYNYKGIYIESTEGSRQKFPIPEPILDIEVELRLIKLIEDIFNDKYKIRDPKAQKVFLAKHEVENTVSEIFEKLKSLNSKGDLLMEMEDFRTSYNWVYYHSLNVCLLSMCIALNMGLDDGLIQEIGAAALVHDLGKTWFPIDLINGEELAEEDRRIMREHPTNMFRLLQRLNLPLNVCYGVWQHHEKFDGSGYPNGLKGDKILLSSRIIAVANSYDNMVNVNPYGKGVVAQNEALEYMFASPEFDSECVRALSSVVAPYPVGTRVELSNGKKGVVVINNKSMPLRPILNVDGNAFNLFENVDVTIIKRF